MSEPTKIAGSVHISTIAETPPRLHCEGEPPSYRICPECGRDFGTPGDHVPGCMNSKRPMPRNRTKYPETGYPSTVPQPYLKG